MRRRLTKAVLAPALVAIAASVAAPVAAQVPPDDDSAWGDLIGDGADIGAFDGADQPAGGGGGSGSTGPRSNIQCELTVANLGGASGNMTMEQLQAEYDAVVRGGGDVLYVDRLCTDRTTGQILSFDTIAWTPAVGNPVSPEMLRDLARERLQLPSPAARMAPSPAVGTTAQLPTYFWLTNWPAEPLWEEASAGTVTARVTATPMRQTWRITDELRGVTHTENCGATAGVAFDPANPNPAGACTWTPEHSSAGQPNRHPVTGEPCFDASVTVYWNLSWDSNITTPVAFDPVPMTSVACIVVHEIQAVVSSNP
jgi:hypothetical protein